MAEEPEAVKEVRQDHHEREDERCRIADVWRRLLRRCRVLGGPGRRGGEQEGPRVPRRVKDDRPSEGAGPQEDRHQQDARASRYDGLKDRGRECAGDEAVQDVDQAEQDGGQEDRRPD